VTARLAVAAIIGLACSVGLLWSGWAQGQMGNGIGLFDTQCEFSHRASDDPIVFPGEPGRSHPHDFIGNHTTNAFSTPDSLRKGRTSCARNADTAAYWFPTLYRDETRAPITPRTIRADYSAGRRDFASIQPFPPEFRMIAGDAKASDRQVGEVVDWACPPGKMLEAGRSPDNSPRAQALRAAIAQFAAAAAKSRKRMAGLRVSIRRYRQALRRRSARGRAAVRPRRALKKRLRAYRRERRAYRRARNERANRQSALESYLFGGGTSIPTCAPGADLILRIRFPDCWDGRNVDSPDHKSHVAYSRYSKEQGGWVCPGSYPVLVPMLQLTVLYPTSGGPDVRLSPGDVDAGHADFMNGWNQEKLAELVRTCLNTDRYCGGGDKPKNPAPAPTPSPIPSPAPSPSPSPSPAPSPSPSPAPSPSPSPSPAPSPSPLPLPELP
jgi:Domain of unknown function (DUF1996)